VPANHARHGVAQRSAATLTGPHQSLRWIPGAIPFHLLTSPAAGRARQYALFRADGKTTPTGAPKNPLQLGATFWHFRHESRVTSPPIWVQNLMLPPLWVLAKVFGVRPYYHHWDSRT